ncbi:MAG: hypothetical protein KDI37_17195, partial [Xanthomonadales bacterium]|nr:hypothetical protein [Xanthomonadales bacterium]
MSAAANDQSLATAACGFHFGLAWVGAPGRIGSRPCALGIGQGVNRGQPHCNGSVTMKHKSVDFSPRRQLVLLAASLALLFSSL